MKSLFYKVHLVVSSVDQRSFAEFLPIELIGQLLVLVVAEEGYKLQ